MGEPHVATTDRQGAGGKLRQRDRLGLAVGNLRPRLDDILVLVRPIAEHDSHGIDRVFHRNSGNRSPPIGGAGGGLPSRYHQFSRHVAIGMLHGQGSLCRTVHAVGRIGVHPSVAGCLEAGQIEVTQLLTEIHILWLFAVLNVENHRRAFRLDGHLLRLRHQ